MQIRDWIKSHKIILGVCVAAVVLVCGALFFVANRTKEPEIIYNPDAVQVTAERIDDASLDEQTAIVSTIVYGLDDAALTEGKTTIIWATEDKTDGIAVKLQHYESLPDGSYLIEGTIPELYEIFESIDIDERIEVDMSQFVANGDFVEVTSKKEDRAITSEENTGASAMAVMPIMDTGNLLASMAASSRKIPFIPLAHSSGGGSAQKVKSHDIRGGKAEKTYESSGKIGKGEVSASAKVFVTLNGTLIHLKIDETFRAVPSTKDVRSVQITTELEGETGCRVEMEAKSDKLAESRLKVGELPNFPIGSTPFTGTVEFYVTIEANGEASLTASFAGALGGKYSNGSGWKPINTFGKPKIDEPSAEGHIGAYLHAVPEIKAFQVVQVVGIDAKAGPVLGGEVKLYDTPPTVCFTGSVDFSVGVGLDQSMGIGSILDECNVKVPELSTSKSIFGNWHWEDGELYSKNGSCSHDKMTSAKKDEKKKQTGNKDSSGGKKKKESTSSENKKKKSDTKTKTGGVIEEEDVGEDEIGEGNEGIDTPMGGEAELSGFYYIVNTKSAMKKEGGKYVVIVDLYEVSAEKDASGATYPSETLGAELVQTDCQLTIDPASRVHTYASDQSTQSANSSSLQFAEYTIKEAYEGKKALYYHDKTTGEVNTMGTMQDKDIWMFLYPRIDANNKNLMMMDVFSDYEKDYIK